MRSHLSKLFIVIGFTTALSGYLFLRFVYHPIPQLTEPQTISIEKGMSLRKVIQRLQTQDILGEMQATVLFLWAKLNRVDTQLKAGTYILQDSFSLDQLMNMFIDGKVAQFSVTIIEGDSFRDFRENLAKHPAVKQTVDELSEVAIAKILKIDFPALEGAFFPDTYYFKDQTADVILYKLAHDTMQQHLKDAWAKRAKNLAIQSPFEALILASIIEKESQVASERKIISGVFHRRLFKNMRLQADPTVRYGLDKLTESLTKKDLKDPHPYNTYVHNGLPPTPIALPGLASIHAALHPDRSEYLYFVAKGDGSHYFSENLKKHNKAVQKYRRHQQKQNQKQEAL